MTSVAFFAHDRGDAAVRKRVRAFERSGFRVIGFAMRRGDDVDAWDAVDLGRTYDARFVHRLGAILSGSLKACRARERLERSDIVYARNLDMLACAWGALGLAGLTRPIVYECLDVHRLMHRQDVVGGLLRGIESFLLKRCSLLVVSSPAFLREYFEVHHRGRFQAHLIENRLAEGDVRAPRPLARIPHQPLRLGWFGVLRCRRSLDLLESVALRFGEQVQISLRGYADLNLPDLPKRVARQANITYEGPYRSPDDLESIYGQIDLVWAADFHDAGFNSRWLLPNRIYEGGYFGSPAIAPGEAETGKWLRVRGGFVIEEPLEATLPKLIERLLDSPSEIQAASARLLSLPRETFVQPVDEMRTLIDRAIATFRERSHRESKFLAPAADRAAPER